MSQRSYVGPPPSSWRYSSFGGVRPPRVEVVQYIEKCTSPRSDVRQLWDVRCGGRCWPGGVPVAVRWFSRPESLSHKSFSLARPAAARARTLDQINTGCTVCPGGTGRNSRVWLQVCIGCRVYVYVLRTALRVPEVCTFANNNRGLSTTQFHGRNASPSHSSHWMVANAVASATGGKGPWAKLSGRRARSARGFGG